MNAVELIKINLENNSNMALALINDLKDNPTTQPTTKGGNHALWILGHFAVSESEILHTFILGNESFPLAELKEKFDFKTEPTNNPENYPSFDEVMAKYQSAHAELVAYVDSITDADLDKVVENCPEDWKQYFGTVGHSLITCTTHPAFHYGQLADIRRSLGRTPLMA